MKITCSVKEVAGKVTGDKSTEHKSKVEQYSDKAETVVGESVMMKRSRLARIKADQAKSMTTTRSMPTWEEPR